MVPSAYCMVWPRVMQVSKVLLVEDIQLQAETWQREDSSRPAVVANRNITISSRPPHRTIDFAFLASNWLKMAAGTRLNITNTILKQSRCVGSRTIASALQRQLFCS